MDLCYDYTTLWKPFAESIMIAMEERLRRNAPGEMASLMALHRGVQVMARGRVGLARARHKQGIRIGDTAGPKGSRGVYDDAVHK